MTEDKATRYHRLRRRCDLALLAWGAVCLAGLAATGAWQAISRSIDHWSGGLLWLGGPASALALILIHETFAFPLAWYAGFSLEHRYGLSRQTRAAWLAEHGKALAVAWALASGAVLVTYGAMTSLGGWWWLVAGLGLSTLVALLATLAPVLLLPLFFRFTPLSRPALVARLEALAARAGTRVVGAYEWALGERSSKANAALAGLGATRRILVSDTMLADYTDEEIEVVLAHELGHHVHRDIWRGLAFESALIVAGFGLTDRVLRALGPSLGIAAPADLASLPLLVLSAGGVSVLLTPVALALSRRHERRADLFALRLTGNPAAFISAMRRLGAQNLAEERPGRLVRWLFHSHPPLDERLSFARNWPNDSRTATGSR